MKQDITIHNSKSNDERPQEIDLSHLSLSPMGLVWVRIPCMSFLLPLSESTALDLQKRKSHIEFSYDHNNIVSQQRPIAKQPG